MPEPARNRALVDADFEQWLIRHGGPVRCCEEWPECSHLLAWLEWTETHPGFEERMREHRQRWLRTWGALRAQMRLPGERERLRVLRRAAASSRPRRDRRPAVILAFWAGVVLLVLLVLSERAG